MKTRNLNLLDRVTTTTALKSLKAVDFNIEIQTEDEASKQLTSELEKRNGVRYDRLPFLPSSLLKLAAEDFYDAYKSGEYKFNMHYWHRRKTLFKKCEVCLAGAVLANRFQIPQSVTAGAFSCGPNDVNCRTSFTDHDSHMLRLLDCLRGGVVLKALPEFQASIRYHKLITELHASDDDICRRFKEVDHTCQTLAIPHRLVNCGAAVAPELAEWFLTERQAFPGAPPGFYPLQVDDFMGLLKSMATIFSNHNL